jgi:antitoxin-like ribbon-helix-helix protein
MSTKKKPNPLMAGLEQFDRKAAPPPVLASARAAKPPSRQGAVQIAAFFPEDVRTQLKIVAAEQRRDIQDVLAEALNLIFVKYGKPEIAPRKA